uniref:Uncharacterized protein n=1 Tax=Rhizophora mucronata TaxID=61149 RepID=A0A2P2JI46_RHIMU
MYLHLQVKQEQDDSSRSRQERAAVLPKRTKQDFLSLLGDMQHERYPIYMTGMKERLVHCLLFNNILNNKFWPHFQVLHYTLYAPP